MEKTEKPTPKKIRDARNQGQVFSSNDIISAATMVIGLTLLIFTSQSMVIAFTENIMLAIKIIANKEIDTSINFYKYISSVSIAILLSSVPFLCILSVVSTCAKLCQVGFLLTFQAVQPKIDNISPISFIKKTFSKKSLFEFFKSILKVCIIGSIAAYCILLAVSEMIGVIDNIDINGMISIFTKYLIYIILSCLVPFIVIACADYVIQKRAYIKQLMMSMYEIKKEFKEAEGNPEFKQNRKSFFMELMSSGGSRGVISNPTHYAIVFEYNSMDISSPPVILHKAKDNQALLIINEALRSNVPVLRSPKLARAVYSTLNIGDKIDGKFSQQFKNIITYMSSTACNTKQVHDIYQDALF